VKFAATATLVSAAFAAAEIATTIAEKTDAIANRANFKVRP
jgi:hypothetical protein